MDSVPGKIGFEYEFLSEPDCISNKDRRNVPLILGVEAIFKININEELYFEASFAILEFYKSLFRWKERVKGNEVPEFHYYSIEHADYDDGSIVSLLPLFDRASVKSIWGKSDIYNVFDLAYIVNEFLVLEQKMKEDIERRY